MNKRFWKFAVIWILAAEIVGFFAGILSREGMEIYNATVQQPFLSPPAWVFPVVWGILYALMGFGAAIVTVQPYSTQRSRGLNLMATQLVVNFLWPLLFFNAQAYGFSLLLLILLWILVLWMILTFRTTSKPAAWLQIPYLLWLSFAIYLNAGVWHLNK